MRKAIPNKSATLGQVAVNHTVAIKRVCLRQDCNKELTQSQKKFCSHTCRNIINSPGNTGGPKEKYEPKYSTTIFDEYIAICEAGNEPNLIPTRGSFLVMQGARIPTLFDFAEHIKVDVSTLRNWASKHHEFARALDRLKRIQQTQLINNGLSGRYNPTITKLLLGVNHGMIEKSEVDSTHRMIGLVKLIYEGAGRIEGQGRSECL